MTRPNSTDVPLIPVILCGGSGTRLWPLSRESQPKQFIPLIGDSTLFQASLSRSAAIVSNQPPIIVTAEDHRFLVAEQLSAANLHGEIILEPVGRNTAPAIAVAAFRASQRVPAALLLVLSSDHLIADEEAFVRTVRSAIAQAQSGRLVTFGVTPSRPETGFGYIELGPDAAPGFAIRSFKEKPDTETAKHFFTAGGFLWNSGMFLFRADIFLEELSHHAPAIFAAAQSAVEGARQDMDFMRLDSEAFASSPSDSIDYAVMEHTDRGIVIPLECDWNDLGSWEALSAIIPLDQSGNAIRGDVFASDTTNCLLYSEDRLLTAIGISDAVVVVTPDAVLVTRKSSDETLKSVVAQLKAKGRSETAFHARVHRPWGTYEGIGRGERYQVKRIRVRAGASLSLQMHHHRAEHWVVVRGTAKIQRGEEHLVLSENESIYIPLGAKHRLENPGRIDLELIEVQSGAYLGEDDIVRFEDYYRRKDEPHK